MRSLIYGFFVGISFFAKLLVFLAANKNEHKRGFFSPSNHETTHVQNIWQTYQQHDNNTVKKTTKCTVCTHSTCANRTFDICMLQVFPRTQHEWHRCNRIALYSALCTHISSVSNITRLHETNHELIIFHTDEFINFVVMGLGKIPLIFFFFFVF